MAAVKRIDDEVRIRVLDALLKKNSVTPNIRQLQKYTDYHKATIKSSLDFLSEEGVLTGFGPKIDFRKFGYKLEVKSILQVDQTSDKKVWDKFLKQAEKDPSLVRLSAIIGSGNWNVLATQLYKDVESYHKEVNENYYDAIPGIFNVIKDKQVFYATEPYYKFVSRTKSVIDLIKRDKGFD